MPLPIDSDSEKHALHKILLQFRNGETEQEYRAAVISSSLNYVRTAWASVLLFGGAFFALDVPFFKERASTIIAARIALLTLASAILALTWVKRFHRHLVWCPTIFILSVGSFCILQTALSPPGAYSPYAMGIFLAFCGIFCTVGMGFSYSVFALVGTLLIFEVLLGAVIPTSADIFIVYNFFYVCFILAFGFLGYYTEAISRKQFISSKRLKESLDNIETLETLLPLCACCKQIRDDKGYWNKLETYLSEHTDIQFTHGICPECARKIYPDM